jgi:hypothetical protein
MVGAVDVEDLTAFPAPNGAAVTGVDVVGVVVVLEALTVPEGCEVFTLVDTSVGALALGAAVGRALTTLGAIVVGTAVGEIRALEGSFVVGADLFGETLGLGVAGVEVGVFD